MSKGMSKTQIDRLGDRLRKGNITEDDIRLLDQYRRSFREAYDTAIGRIRSELFLEPTGRPAKSTTSISDKLRRESIRLTQIQDIAGCRLIVENIADQDKVIESLVNLFEHVNIVDRREQPSHGYRAVHVIADCNGKLIEIQVRTALKHLWAELSEKFSDVIDPAIKYGGGDKDTQEVLALASSAIAALDRVEVGLAGLHAQSSSIGSIERSDREKEIERLQEKLASGRSYAFRTLQRIIDNAEKFKREQ